MLRKRSFFIWVGLLLTTVLWLSTDPDLGLYQDLPFGSSFVSLITIIVSTVPWLVLLHIARKALFDYKEADIRRTALIALKSPTGAGLVVVGIAIGILAIAIIIAAVAVNV